MSDPVTSAVEELLEENVFLPPATASPSSTSSMLTPLITTFLKVLARVEEKVVEHLPLQAQKKFHALDAWGSTSLGFPHSGIIITCLLLLLVLGLSLYFVGIGRARGHKPLPGGKQGRARPSHVVLLGPCGAGKTALYHQLLYNTVPETVTSMVESEGILKDKDIRLVDFPGHERLRGGWKKQFLDAGKVAGVIFVVDAADFPTHKVREAAEFLYDLLTHAAMDDGPPLLVACHKSDLPGAKAPARIKALLTSELERLRKTQGGAMMDGDGEEEEDRLPLGRVAVPLNLDVDAPSELTFAATSVAQQTQMGGNDAFEEDVGIEPLMTFINDKSGR